MDGKQTRIIRNAAGHFGLALFAHPHQPNLHRHAGSGLTGRKVHRVDQQSPCRLLGYEADSADGEPHCVRLLQLLRPGYGHIRPRGQRIQLD